jgi:hypothetical protein
MSKTKHTPAPLLLTETGEANNYMLISEKNWLASIYINGEILPDQQKKIVQLMAAAPELLEALIFCKSVIEQSGMFDRSEQLAFDAADAAIKKATE